MVKFNFSDSSLPGPRAFSPLGLGGAAFSGEGGGYGFGEISERQCSEIMERALDRGVNTIDLAPIYGYGLAEKRVGRILAEKSLRERFLAISKGGITWHSNRRVNLDNSPGVVEKMFHQTLKDLKCDYLDLYLLHAPDPRVDSRRPWEVLIKLKEKGLVRAIGLSNTNAQEIEKVESLHRVEVVQGELNLFNYKHQEPFLDLLEQKGLPFIAWGTLDKGVLSGKFGQGEQKFDRSDFRSWAPWWKKRDHAARRAIVGKLLNFGNLPQLALASNLSHPAVMQSLVGCRSTQHLTSLTSDDSKAPEVSAQDIEQARLLATLPC